MFSIRLISRAQAIALMALLSITLLACGGGGGDGGGSAPAAPAVPPDGAVLQSITVSPASTSVAVGGSRQFTATGYYDDGKSYNITSSVVWSSSPSNVLFTSPGLAKSIVAGGITIYATDAGTGISGSATLSVSDGGSQGTSEGSITSPVPLVLNAPHAGTIATNSFSFYTFTTEEAGQYYISVSGHSTDVKWELYSDAGYSNLVVTCDRFSYTFADEDYFITLEAGKDYYIRVSELDSQPSTYEIKAVDLYNEGTDSVPVGLTLAETRYGTVNGAGTSYYSFTADANDAYVVHFHYLFAVSYSSNSIISIYDDPSFSTGLLRKCDSMFIDSYCGVNALTEGQTYYVKLERPYSDSSDMYYTISAYRGISVGSVYDPVHVVVGNTPYPSGVDPYISYSYYVFDTSTAGTYFVNVSGADPYASIGFGLDDDFFAANYLSWHSGYGNFTSTLTGLDSNTTYYIFLHSYGSAETFDISVTAGQNEGSPNDPAFLDVQTPFTYTAYTDSGGLSFYYFTANWDGSYDISITSPPGGADTSAMSWELFADPGYGMYTSRITCDAGDGQDCTTYTMNKGQTYYLRIRGTGALGAYNINIVNGLSEGSPSAPLPLEPGVNNKLNVRSRSSLGAPNSYYSFITDTAGDYSMIANNVIGSTLHFYEDFSGSSLGSCSGTPIGCVIKGLQPQTQYFIKLWGNSTEDNTFELLIEPEAPLGCTTSGICFDFEDGLFPAEFTTSGDAAWLAYTIVQVNGTYGFRSGTIAKNGSSCFEYTSPGATSEVTFNLSTDSEAGSDYLVFYIDGVPQGSWSGLTAWTAAGYTAASGVHAYKWCYERDQTADAVGVADRAWVDDINIY